MNARRLVAVAAATLAVTLLVSSGGFSSVNADRGVSVNVADDANAFVGIETHSRTLENRDTPKRVTLLTVENNFAIAAEVTSVSLAGGGPPAPTVEDETLTTDGRLRPGESTSVTAKVVCAVGEETVSLDLAVTAGSGTRVELTRAVTVTCVTPRDSETETERESETERDGS